MASSSFAPAINLASVNPRTLTFFLVFLAISFAFNTISIFLYICKCNISSFVGDGGFSPTFVVVSLFASHAAIASNFFCAKRRFAW
jgi:hypothetical protein